MAFNTAISAMMVFTNHLAKLDVAPREAVEKLVAMLSPFAPHVAEEAWAALGHTGTIAYVPWVQWDEALCIDNTSQMGVQVNGKVRGSIELANDATQDEAMETAMAVESVKKFVDGKDIKKVIYVPGKIVNIIAK